MEEEKIRMSKRENGSEMQHNMMVDSVFLRGMCFLYRFWSEKLTDQGIKTCEA